MLSISRYYGLGLAMVLTMPAPMPVLDTRHDCLRLLAPSAWGGQEAQRKLQSNRHELDNRYVRPLDSKPLSGWIVVSCSLLLIGAVVATVAAALSAALYCSDPPNPTCDRGTLAVTQLVVAGFGLLPAVLMVIAAVRGSPRFTAAMLGLALVTYLAWGVLNAALFHGWDNVP